MTPQDPSVTRPLPVRRPPAPADTRASVTRLARVEEPVPVASVQGTLALELGTAPRPLPPPELRLVPSPGAPTEAQREVELWAATFAQAAVEVISGDRPVSQLLRWTTAGVYHDLERRVRILARAARPAQRVRSVRPQVRSVHVCQPTVTVAEVSVHVRHGARSRALAARLEQRDGRWRCTALQLG